MEQETKAAFVRGEEWALEEVIDTFSKPLLRYCMSILCDLEEAKDVLQETFIKAYEKRRHYRLGSSLNAWLYRIAYTTAIDAIRKRKRRFKLIKEKSESVDSIRENGISEPLNSILLSLSPADRALLYGKVLDEKSYKELSQILNVSEATLRKRFERLRGKLAKEVKHKNSYIKKECLE